ncbi:MAG: phosphoribosylglycinamide formyltransferase [Pseudomonadota bacterium]
MKLGFLASHGGSSLRFIHAAIARGELSATIDVIIGNNRDAFVLQWARQTDITTRHISAKTHPASGEEDRAIRDTLRRADVDLVVLSGYMKRLGPETLGAYPARILNIHPSLLPEFGGQGMYGDRVHAAVLAAKSARSGATVHWVTEGYDEGEVLAQRTIGVDNDDTLETLRTKVQALEGPLYLDVLQRLAAGFSSDRA